MGPAFLGAGSRVRQGAYIKPDGGAAVPLVDSGAEAGLEWVQVMEMYRGKGLYLLCQLPIAGNYGEEPMTRNCSPGH